MPERAADPDPIQRLVSPSWARLWPGWGHLQTIWPQYGGVHHRWPAMPWRRERWATPDGDFIDTDWLDPPPLEVHPGLAPEAFSPLLVLFHGLEGSSASPYARAFGRWAQAAGWRFALPHFRGCSGEINLAPRAYHSGDHEEIGFMLDRLRQSHRGPMAAVGISLGGNALLRWAQEAGDTATETVFALASISSPLDLLASGMALGRGFNRWAYTPWFLKTMKPKAEAKWAQYPGLFDIERVRQARTLWAFDDAFTAPLHGFRGVLDYWQRASAKPQLGRLRVPSLVLQARNDPFLPRACLPSAKEVAPGVTLWQPPTGGHVGFMSGPWPGHIDVLPQAVMAWVRSHAPQLGAPDVKKPA
jgi:predicted alpha/beta-fold hydrolase